MTPGQVAYDAYAETQLIGGTPGMPTWDQITGSYRAVWDAVAAAVLVADGQPFPVSDNEASVILSALTDAARYRRFQANTARPEPGAPDDEDTREHAAEADDHDRLADAYYLVAARIGRDPVTAALHASLIAHAIVIADGDDGDDGDGDSSMTPGQAAYEHWYSPLGAAVSPWAGLDETSRAGWEAAARAAIAAALGEQMGLDLAGDGGDGTDA